jgi:hypothetical protein
MSKLQPLWLPSRQWEVTQISYCCALRQFFQKFIFRLFWFFIRNVWSISTRSCNREPTQTLKRFVACFFVDLYSPECSTDSFSWCSWLNIGKFHKYPFLVVGILLCTFFFCCLGNVPKSFLNCLSSAVNNNLFF